MSFFTQPHLALGVTKAESGEAIIRHYQCHHSSRFSGKSLPRTCQDAASPALQGRSEPQRTVSALLESY